MNKVALLTETSGDGDRFHKNWTSQNEAYYLHWTREKPANQIQFAFRQHWQTFQPFLDKVNGRRCLEVGCGRGSMSAYFADADWDCTLLDISPKAIELAENAFHQNDLKARFDVGDCLALPYEDNSFDVCFSIGLLEHFNNFDKVIEEQVRVLDSGGLFIAYIVPHIPGNVQEDYQWICELLKTLLPIEASQQKTPIYRSDALSPPYLESISKAGLVDHFHSGIYSLPMISHSIDFPFTLLPEQAENILLVQFEKMINEKGKTSAHQNGWLCEEKDGQAILVCGYKP